MAGDNEFERAFARCLEAAPDIAAFAKLPGRFGFVIEYTDNAANLRYYEPDFVAVDDKGSHFLIDGGTRRRRCRTRTGLLESGVRMRPS